MPVASFDCLRLRSNCDLRTVGPPGLEETRSLTPIPNAATESVAKTPPLGCKKQPTVKDDPMDPSKAEGEEPPLEPSKSPAYGDAGRSPDDNPVPVR